MLNCQKSVYLVKFHCMFTILFTRVRLNLHYARTVNEKERVFCFPFRKRFLKSPSYNRKSTEGITFKTFAIFDRRKRKSMHLKQDKRVTELEHFFVNYCRIVCLALGRGLFAGPMEKSVYSTPQQNFYFFFLGAKRDFPLCCNMCKFMWFLWKPSSVSE